MKDNLLPNVIKVGAVLTAAPRWIGALLAAEGFPLPADWLAWWIPVSAFLSACMAIVEGLAFAYVFEAWRNQTDKDSDNLLYFALFSAVVFVGVLAPYIAAQVKGVLLKDVLTHGLALGAWSVAVGLSTIAIVASVGYAQKRKATRTPAQAQTQAAQTVAHDAQTSERSLIDSGPFSAAVTHTCAHCRREFLSQQALAAHLRFCNANGRIHEPETTRGNQ